VARFVYKYTFIVLWIETICIPRAEWVRAYKKTSSSLS